MSDTPSTPDASSTPESAPYSNHTPASYDIAPEDAALAESLVNLDPIRDLSGPFEAVGNVKLPTQITRENLPPQVLAHVDARLSEVPVKDRTPQIENAIMRQEAENFAYFMRVLAGPGPDANAYQQEFYLVEHELYEAKRQLSERLSALSEIVRHDRKVDQSTGEVWDEPVYRVQGDARSAAEHEVAELKRRMRLLDPDGPERAQRLQRAKWEAVQDAKRLQEEFDIDREAQALADRQSREARIAERAEGYRKFKDTER